MQPKRSGIRLKVKGEGENGWLPTSGKSNMAALINRESGTHVFPEKGRMLIKWLLKYMYSHNQSGSKSERNYNS